MKVLVCGGRDYSGDVATILSKLHLDKRISCIVTGGCSGADALAQKWAHQNDVPLTVHYAQWKLYGSAAGPMRNARMLVLDRPDLVVAFPGGRGTADMIRRAEEAGVKVVLAFA